MRYDNTCCDLCSAVPDNGKERQVQIIISIFILLTSSLAHVSRLRQFVILFTSLQCRHRGP